MNDGSILESVLCPYCNERIEMSIDPSAGSQHYVEDCQVCCRPIEVAVSLTDAGDPSVSLRAENES